MEVITTHINADFDTIASMMAARKLYPDAVLVLPGSKEETVKGFLLQSALYSLEMKKVGSTTTILVGILKERGIPITADEATVMMLGIYEDTGSLSFPSTTVEDYLAAAHLRACGANLGAVSDILAKDFTAEQISLLYDLIQGSKTYTIHGVELVIAEARREEYMGELAVLVHKLRDMEAVNVLFAVCQMGDRVVLVARTRN